MAAQRSSRVTDTAGRLRVVSIAGAAVGFLGGIACSAAMVLAAVGVIGAATAGGWSSLSSMAGMGRASTPGGRSLSRFLLDNGPTILVVSIVLVTLALALRRRPAAVGAALVGAVMYWGMYMQGAVTIMYVTIAAGLITWLGLVLAPSWFAMKSRG